MNKKGVLLQRSRGKVMNKSIRDKVLVFTIGGKQFRQQKQLVKNERQPGVIDQKTYGVVRRFVLTILNAIERNNIANYEDMNLLTKRNKNKS